LRVGNGWGETYEQDKYRTKELYRFIFKIVREKEKKHK